MVLAGHGEVPTRHVASREMDASVSFEDAGQSTRGLRTSATAHRWPTIALSNRVLLWLGLPVVGSFMVLTALDVGGFVVVWENAHWTAAGLLAFALATGGATRSGGIERHLRTLVAVSAGIWVLGQFAWNTQVYLGPFDIPSLADVGYLGAMVPALLALVLLVRGRLTRGEELAVYLDGAAMFLTISALVAAFAEPMATSGWLMRTIVIGYPVLHLATAAAGLVALLAVRAELAPRGAYLVLAGVALLGIAWVAWLREAIVAIPPAGSGFNYLFSFGIVALGAGGATWSARRDAGERYRRFAEGALWLLPVAALAACVAIILVRRIAGAPFDVSDVAASGVIVVAGVRQALLVRERDRLLSRERESREELDQAFAARAEAQALYQALVENVPAVVYLDQEDITVTDGGRLAYMSPRVVGLLGYEPSAFIEDPELFPSLIHPADREAALRAVHNHWLTGEPLRTEYRLFAADGRTVWVRDEAYSVAQSDGRRISQGVLFDTTDQKHLEARLTHAAQHDPLTGLVNRTVLRDQLQARLASRRRASSVAVLFIDVDDFKVVNDTLGHETGDALLLEVGRRLQKERRSRDTAARMGGDEFTILLSGIRGAKDAVMVTERIRRTLRRPIQLGDRTLTVAVSIGIAIATDATASAEDLLAEADTALYEAKARGKDRHVLFDPSMRDRAWSRLDLEADLRRAIDHGEFEIHYQPILELASGRMIEVEALVRWQHPVRGILPAGAFIPLAEANGLVVPIGRLVLEQACRQLQAWHDAFPQHAGLRVSVNVSARQAEDPAFVELVARQLAETGLEPHDLSLEITETAMLADTGASDESLRRLGELGVNLAIDDFATGFSALDYVKRLSVRTLKIDRSFVSGLGHNAEDSAIVAATIAFAHGLGLTATAEGIENATQLGALRELGCDRGQGYLFARPLPAASLEELLADAAEADTATPPTRHAA
jgi:diguanylate cyclase (GGDEF)-like protein/PAS domain S-box-containing protein